MQRDGGGQTENQAQCRLLLRAPRAATTDRVVRRPKFRRRLGAHAASTSNLALALFTRARAPRRAALTTVAVALTCTAHHRGCHRHCSRRRRRRASSSSARGHDAIDEKRDGEGARAFAANKKTPTVVVFCVSTRFLVAAFCLCALALFAILKMRRCTNANIHLKSYKRALSN